VDLFFGTAMRHSQAEMEAGGKKAVYATGGVPTADRGGRVQILYVRGRGNVSPKAVHRAAAWGLVALNDPMQSGQRSRNPLETSVSTVKRTQTIRRLKFTVLTQGISPSVRKPESFAI
jgi:hypothetical protein